MERKLASLISFVFHPLLMPTVGLLILMNTPNYIAYSMDPRGKLAIFVIIFIGTFVMPIVGVLSLIQMGHLKSIYMPGMEERRLPYILTAVLYALVYVLLNQHPLPQPILSILLGANLAIILVLIINSKWKISAHMVGIGGLTGAIFALSERMAFDFTAIIMLLILAGGLVGFARLKLAVHNSGQVYAGYLLGFFCEFVLVMLL